MKGGDLMSKNLKFFAMLSGIFSQKYIGQGNNFLIVGEKNLHRIKSGKLIKKKVRNFFSYRYGV
jgi:hypothetical protein